MSVNNTYPIFEYKIDRICFLSLFSTLLLICIVQFLKSEFSKSPPLMKLYRRISLLISLVYFLRSLDIHCVFFYPSWAWELFENQWSFLAFSYALCFIYTSISFFYTTSLKRIPSSFLYLIITITIVCWLFNNFCVLWSQLENKQWPLGFFHLCFVIYNILFILAVIISIHDLNILLRHASIDKDISVSKIKSLEKSIKHLNRSRFIIVTCLIILTSLECFSTYENMSDWSLPPQKNDPLHYDIRNSILHIIVALLIVFFIWNAWIPLFSEQFSFSNTISHSKDTSATSNKSKNKDPKNLFIQHEKSLKREVSRTDEFTIEDDLYDCTKDQDTIDNISEIGNPSKDIPLNLEYINKKNNENTTYHINRHKEIDSYT